MDRIFIYEGLRDSFQESHEQRLVYKDHKNDLVLFILTNMATFSLDFSQNYRDRPQIIENEYSSKSI